MSSKSVNTSMIDTLPVYDNKNQKFIKQKIFKKQIALKDKNETFDVKININTTIKDIKTQIDNKLINIKNLDKKRIKYIYFSGYKIVSGDSENFNIYNDQLKIIDLDQPIFKRIYSLPEKYEVELAKVNMLANQSILEGKVELKYKGDTIKPIKELTILPDLINIKININNKTEIHQIKPKINTTISSVIIFVLQRVNNIKLSDIKFIDFKYEKGTMELNDRKIDGNQIRKHENIKISKQKDIYPSEIYVKIDNPNSLQSNVGYGFNISNNSREGGSKIKRKKTYKKKSRNNKKKSRKQKYRRK